MRIRTGLSLGALLCAANAPLAAAPAPPAFSLSVSEQEIVVAGASPGQQVALFSVGQDVHDGGISIVSLGRILSGDVNGALRFQPVGGVPLRSIWLAVDLKNGGYASGHRSDFDANETPSTRLAFPAGNKQVRVPMTLGYFFLARAGAGAWMGRAGDGAPSDADGLADGALGVSLDLLTGVDSTAGLPGNLTAGDVLFAVDSTNLSFVATRR